MSAEKSNPRLRLLNTLRDGRPALGTFLMLQSAWTARVVAQTGLDFVIVDCEHGNIGDSDMHESVNAVASSGASPIIRIRGAEPSLIKRALDCGAHALMVPMINTAEEARAVVQASKFPPLGIRGQGSPFSATSFGLTTPEYLQQANANILIIVQIETVQGVENVEEIAKVEGIDAIFIGPNDLAMSVLGYAPARYDEPPYLAAIERVRTTVRKLGKPVGILTPDGDKASEVIRNYDIMAIGGDVKALVGWYGMNLAKVKAALQ